MATFRLDEQNNDQVTRIGFRVFMGRMCFFDFRLIWPQNRNEKDIEVRDRGVEFV